MERFGKYMRDGYRQLGMSDDGFDILSGSREEGSQSDSGSDWGDDTEDKDDGKDEEATKEQLEVSSPV